MQCQRYPKSRVWWGFGGDGISGFMEQLAAEDGRGHDITIMIGQEDVFGCHSY